MDTRITEREVEQLIDKVQYAGHPASIDNTAQENEDFKMVTFCTIRLKNGFVVTGKSECASNKHYSEEEGKKWARADAMDKIYPLIAYQVKQAKYLNSLNEEQFKNCLATDIMASVLKSGATRDEVENSHLGKLALSICPDASILLNFAEKN